MKTRILLATHNPSKIKRYREQLNLESIEFITLKDLGFSINDPEENGSDEWENAKIKAKAYWEITNDNSISSLALDTGFYIRGLSESNQPGKHVQRIAKVLESDSDEIRFKKMTDYYIAIANQFGGEVEAYFRDVYCLYDGKAFYKAENIREITMTNVIYKEDLNFPVASLYKVRGKNYYDLTPEEMKEYLKPGIEAVKKMILEKI